MCSIIGYLGSSISAQDLRAGFDKTISRGPDDTRMLHIGAATLGFPTVWPSSWACIRKSCSRSRVMAARSCATVRSTAFVPSVSG